MKFFIVFRNYPFYSYKVCSSTFSFQILLICTTSFFFIGLDRSSWTLLIFFRNCSLFNWFFSYCFAGFNCTSSSFLRWELELLIWNFLSFLKHAVSVIIPPQPCFGCVCPTNFHMFYFQFSSIAQLCPTLRNPMNCSTAGLPVHHQLLEFTQTHVHRVRDAIQPSHPLSSFSSCPQSLPTSESFPMTQLFTWGGQSTGVSALASFLLMNTQDWSPSEWTGWISFQSKGLSRVFSNTTVQKHQFFSAQLSSQSNSHIHTWPLE